MYKVKDILGVYTTTNYNTATVTNPCATSLDQGQSPLCTGRYHQSELPEVRRTGEEGGLCSAEFEVGDDRESPDAGQPAKVDVVANALRGCRGSMPQPLLVSGRGSGRTLESGIVTASVVVGLSLWR